jgi:hypothetical protein
MDSLFLILNGKYILNRQGRRCMNILMKANGQKETEEIVKV